MAPEALTRAESLVLRELGTGPCSFWHLVSKQDGHFRDFNATLRRLLDQGLIYPLSDALLALTEPGKDQAERGRLASWSDPTCPTCQGRGVAPGPRLTEALARLDPFLAQRPPINLGYDQGPIPGQALLAKMAFLDKRGDLADRSLLVLGDDDLMSVALALTGLCRRITVLEIDRRISSLLRQASQELGLGNFDVYDYDARDALPGSLWGTHDVFVTDPVDTLAAVTLFLSRCLQGLKDQGGVGYFGVTPLETTPAKWLDIQKLLLDMHLVVTDLMSGFSDYDMVGPWVLESRFRVAEEAPVALGPPARPWYISSLFRVVSWGRPNPVVGGDMSYGEELYDDGLTI